MRDRREPAGPPGLARAVVRALTEGYGQVLADPAAGLQALSTQVPGLDPSLQRAELRGLLPAFTSREARSGRLTPRV